MSGKKPKKKTYVPMPKPPPEMAERYRVMLAVMSGQISVSEGARQLGMERNHFQSLMHRGLEGFIEKASPKPGGRPAKSPREAELEAENEKLRRQNEKLHARVETIDRLLVVAGDMLKGRIEPKGRARRKKASEPDDNGGENEEPDGQARELLEGARAMRQLGLPVSIAAAVVGVSPSTVRRWAQRDRARERLRERRGPTVAPVAESVATASIAIIDKLAGQIGVRALQRQVPELSRAQAAGLKRQALTDRERRRKAEATRIEVTIPGLLRGFDAMHVQTLRGPRWLLIAADGSIPFRTTGLVVERYDGPSVALALERDIERHGAPLVYRLDRCKAHTTSEVMAVLAKHGVLILQGPPHHPGFYGQHERQNREHRAILDALGPLDPDALQAAADVMLSDLNSSWPRRSLAWRTPSEAWENRLKTDVDRDALRQEVCDRAARLAQSAAHLGPTRDFFERIALERALAKRGYLSTKLGGWC